MNTEVVQRRQGETQVQNPGRQAQPMAPAVDIIEDADGITLRGEVAIALPEGLDPFYAELRSASWERSFTLSRELDADHVDANLKDGVLTLRIPKAEHAKPRKVDVKLA